MISSYAIHRNLATHVLYAAISFDVIKAARFVICAGDAVTSAQYLASIDMIETFALHYMAATAPARPLLADASIQPALDAHASMDAAMKAVRTPV